MAYNYDFDKSLVDWRRVPLDDFDYMEADDFLILSPEQRKELINIGLSQRYAPIQWRNKDNCLLEFMQPKRWINKTVMDFGCGLGLDSIVFNQHGAFIYLADINPRTLMAAQQTLACWLDVHPKRLIVVGPDWPYWRMPPGSIDLFWSLGCLHHTPKGPDLIRRACQCLTKDGECRVVLYSDRQWEKVMGEPPPENVTGHPRFDEWVRKMDAVGNYADWYNEEKLKKAVEKFAVVTECKYISADVFIGAVIKPK